MMAVSIADWASMASAFFAAVAALISTVSVYMSGKIARKQREADLQIAREQRAADSVRRYTELALQYPDLSTEKDKKDEQREQWFASFVLIMKTSFEHMKWMSSGKNTLSARLVFSPMNLNIGPVMTSMTMAHKLSLSLKKP